MHREKGELVHDNPLYSPTEQSEEKNWDVMKETSTSTKKAERSIPGSNSAACEIVSPIKTLKSSEKASPDSSRKAIATSGSKTGNVVQCMARNPVDEETQDREEFMMKMEQLIEQEDEAAGQDATPVIIQYGGVASYHPVYSPFAPRPRFRRFRGEAPANRMNKARPAQEIPEIKRSEEESKEDSPQSADISCVEPEITLNSGSDKPELTPAENEPQLTLNAGSDNNENESKSPSSFEPAADHTIVLRSVKTEHKMAANSLSWKGSESHLRFRKRRPMIWTLSILLVFCFSIFSLLPVGSNSFSTNSTVPSELKCYTPSTAQPSGSNSTGLKEYFKRFQEPSMASTKSSFKLDRIKESSRANLTKISDIRLRFFRSGFQYLAKVKSISTRSVVDFINFCINLLASMRNVAAEVPRFCKSFFSKSIIDNYTSAENHGTDVGKFGKPELFKQYHLPVTGSMDTGPGDTLNTYSEIEAQGNEHDRDHDDLYIEDQSVPATREQHNGINQEQAISTYAEIHSYPKLDQISEEFQENKLWTNNRILENSLFLLEHIENEQTNLEDLYINATSERPATELNPHEFWWLTWAGLLVVATIVFILLMLRGLIPSKKYHSGSHSPHTSKIYKFYKPEGDYIAESEEKQKSRAFHFAKINKARMESTESPRFGSFIDYVDIPVPKEGSRGKELKITPVRRSARIRNKSVTPVGLATMFSSPPH